MEVIPGVAIQLPAFDRIAAFIEKVAMSFVSDPSVQHLTFRIHDEDIGTQHQFADGRGAVILEVIPSAAIQFPAFDRVTALIEEIAMPFIGSPSRQHLTFLVHDEDIGTQDELANSSRAVALEVIPDVVIEEPADLQSAVGICEVAFVVDCEPAISEISAVVKIVDLGADGQKTDRFAAIPLNIDPSLAAAFPVGRHNAALAGGCACCCIAGLHNRGGFYDHDFLSFRCGLFTGVISGLSLIRSLLLSCLLCGSFVYRCCCLCGCFLSGLLSDFFLSGFFNSLFTRGSILYGSRLCCRIVN